MIPLLLSFLIQKDWPLAGVNEGDAVPSLSIPFLPNPAPC